MSFSARRFSRTVFRLFAPAFVFLVGCISPAVVEAQALESSASQSLVWNMGRQGAYVTDLFRDSRGRFWAATEGNGLWMSDKNASNGWRGFDASNSDLVDNAVYTLAEDRLGRIWAGTLGHGVSVWNGKGWKNYGVLDAPLGERIFDIAVSPLDGSVWIASSRGLARYNPQSKRWSSYNREQGLPSDQVQALAFDKQGTLYLATPSDGLAIGRAKDDYQVWRHVTAEKPYPTPPGSQASGYGLPSNQLNDVLVARNGSVFVATLNGLAKSSDGGVTWTYVRGRDYAAKVQQRSASTPESRDSPSLSPNEAALGEDNVTRLAQDGAGRLWLGHRWHIPFEVWDETGDRKLYSGDKDAWRGNTAPVDIPSQSVQDRTINDYVTSFLLLPNGQVAVGRYGGGLTVTSWRPPAADNAGAGDASGDGRARRASSTRTSASSAPAWPMPMASPTLSELQAALASLRNDDTNKTASKDASLGNAASTITTLANQTARTQGPLQPVALSARKAPFPAQRAVFLGEDWNTQGDWVGRYGSRYAMLCAMQSPMNHEVVADVRYRVQGELGPHATPGDSLRSFVHWERADANPNVLYNPVIGYRREAEWDDHSEVIQNTTDLGDVWARVSVPQGTHKVTAYFYNKDGDAGPNRFRDYLLEIRPGAPTTLAAEKMPPLAWTRVRDFRAGGVYKSFLVQGAGDYWLRVARNYSFNTILQAVFVDAVAGLPASPFDRMSSPYLNREYSDPPQVDETALAPALKGREKAQTPKTQTLNAARELWRELDKRAGDLKSAPSQWRLRMLCYRAALTSDASDDLLTNWRWKLALWLPEDSRDFGQRVQGAYNRTIQENPELATTKR